MRSSVLILLPLLFIAGGCRKDSIGKDAPRAPVESQHTATGRSEPPQEPVTETSAPVPAFTYIPPGVLPKVKPLFDSSSGEAIQTTIDMAGIPTALSEQVAAAIRAYYAEAKSMQAELFGAREARLDQPLIIPGVPGARLATSEAPFRSRLPAELGERKIAILSEAMAYQIRREFGSDIPVTLVKNPGGSISDMRKPPELLPGLKFLITRPDSDRKPQRCYTDAVQQPGLRYDFLKAADGIDGHLHIPMVQ